VRWRFLAIGKPKLAFAAAGVEEYARRLRGMAKFELEFLRPGADEGRQLLEKSAGCFRLVLDERGRQFSSPELARFIEKQELGGTDRIAILIGGADGHSHELRNQADGLWSLSQGTLPHELALVVALEQIYRALTISAGHPYHRI